MDTTEWLNWNEDRASLVGQTVKGLPAMREIWARSLGQEDPLEKVMATHSSILAWRIPWTEEPGGPQSMRLQRVNMSEWLTPYKVEHLHICLLSKPFSFYSIPECPTESHATEWKPSPSVITWLWFKKKKATMVFTFYNEALLFLGHWNS